jgi:predicted transcriptional regulator YheO/tRNA A-37 threonylcarbamoyl transferase component Bud32
MSLAAGSRLGPYEIQSAIGAGGMGEVYKARDTRLDRTVAIKVLPPEVRRHPDREARFEREAKAISQLTHPHICTLYDIGRDGDTMFLVMEHLDGAPLAARLEKGPLPLDQALRIGAQIAEALEVAHRQGIIHRDLKPANVMLTKTGAKLLDFGLAKLRSPGPVAIEPTNVATRGVSATAEGVLLGTLPYMAPEQLEGRDADARTDLWALGCVLYEMVVGRRAFEGKSQASLIGAIMTAEPSPMPAVQPLAPAVLDRVVRTCLAKDPDERWQSAADVKRELQWIAEERRLSQTPIPGRAASTTADDGRRRRWRPWQVAVAGLALVATGVVLTLAYVSTLRQPLAAPPKEPTLAVSGRPLASYPFYPIAVSLDGSLYVDKAKFMEAVAALRQNPDAKAVADLLYLERKQNITLHLGEPDRRLFQALVKQVAVPDADRQEAYRDRLFEVYKQIVDGLGQSFAGTPIEIVLHDVRNPMQSIQALQNPISGRRLYQPTTNFGVELIKWYAVHPEQGSSFVSYDLKLADGTPIKSTTIPLFDAEYGLVGFVCMNIRISDISETGLDEKTKQFLAAFRRTSSSAGIAEIIDNARKNLARTSQGK